MKILYINNDILEEQSNIVCHQVNSRGVIETDLAERIKNKFPYVYLKYKNVCDIYNEKHLSFILHGKAQIVDWKNLRCMHTPLDDFVYDNSNSVCNLFCQDPYEQEVQTDTDYLKSAIMNPCFLISQPKNKKFSTTISIPYGLNCKAGTNNWNKIEPVIIAAFKNGEKKYNLDITLKIIQNQEKEGT